MKSEGSPLWSVAATNDISDDEVDAGMEAARKDWKVAAICFDRWRGACTTAPARL
jgi:hypothetical protein